MFKKMIKRIHGAKNDKGFTLIELMVVVIIIGILAAVAIPQFVGQTDKAKEKAAKADLKMIGNALEMYYNENNDYPSALSGLSPDYLKKVPSKSPWNTDYDYTKNSRTSFTLSVANSAGTNLYYPGDL